MNAKDKFQILNDAVKVDSLIPNCHILMHYEFFRGLRKQMRGLEEHLAMRARGEGLNKGFVVTTDHDFHKTHVYRVTNVEGDTMVIRFEGEWCIFGSEATV